MALATQTADFAAARERMVSAQMEARGIKDARVLAAIRATPRHLFVPEAMQAHAYEDTPLPIGHGQTISQPYIVASMTELLEVKPHHKVLEIGTGSGYQAAILSRLVAEVDTIEIVEPLANQARERLRAMGYSNVHVRTGDGYAGWPEKAPFDRIILTASPPQIPQALIDQLKNGGRLVSPEGRQWQDLIIIDKDAHGKVTRRTAYAVQFVPMVPSPREY
jgi:protein-L-isoaspartate(D-aspartate) O-methyltransferase